MRPVAGTLTAAPHDPRQLRPDDTPRGVEIDRIEMIRHGFAHLRELLQAISAAAEAERPRTDLRL
ncbi:hypothetical protein [Mangrovicoccus algicola]|uniref:Uncharacterized protein n=1 Tax=Mangrovicoccus algicola TaxID=2771008 RepID=A0A8J7CWV7_9RHOB|nr:hypothetical protein [Mangrovicoccus algicola]MBE3639899.1 hypothetical protein [Mangrovicoccus algicola]